MVAQNSTTEPALMVRTATHHDLDAIGDLWTELMTFHKDLDPRFHVPPQGRQKYLRHIAAALHDSSFRVLVAEDMAGQILGYVSGYIAQNPPYLPNPRYAFIADLCVTGTSRRRGVGRRLVEAICEWFRKNRLHAVQLNVAHLNPVSQGFWRNMGCSDYIDHMWMNIE